MNAFDILINPIVLFGETPSASFFSLSLSFFYPILRYFTSLQKKISRRTPVNYNPNSRYLGALGRKKYICRKKYPNIYTFFFKRSLCFCTRSLNALKTCAYRSQNTRRDMCRLTSIRKLISPMDHYHRKSSEIYTGLAFLPCAIF